ncbi:hypothetical protein GCM10008908_35520 [Clostridium subterminale]|uniref:Resolvase/invertase-type recombinase catalytic domain-containing protein n=2 Tax=Clostridium subterminale TaxID=1550 RepID=A0ABP3W6G7_CLOSU
MLFHSYDNLFDIILVKPISRFGRNSIDLLDAENKLRGSGINIFHQENLSANEIDNDLLVSMLIAIAQVESESNSEAIK